MEFLIGADISVTFGFYTILINRQGTLKGVFIYERFADDSP